MVAFYRYIMRTSCKITLKLPEAPGYNSVCVYVCVDIYNSTQLSPWEATNCSAFPEFPSILWNAKVHYRVHKSPPLVPIPVRWIQSIPPHHIPLWSILIRVLSYHLHLSLPTGPFPSGFPTRTLYAFLFSIRSAEIKAAGGTDLLWFPWQNSHK
jgi:hypothetical protein